MLPRFLLVITVIIWGWSFVASKICLNYMAPYELIGLRFLIALPVLYSIIILKRIRLDFRKYKWRLILGSFLISVHFFIQVTGINHTSATNTGWIIAVTPLVMALFAWLILKEYLTLKTVFGIAVATAGIILLISNGHIRDLGWLSSYGDWLILASAHTWALYSIVTRDISRANDPLAVTALLITPPAIIAATVMAFSSDWGKFMRMPADAIIALLFLGLLAMAAGQWFWQVGMAKIGAAKAGIFLYLEPLATTALAVPYLKEPFGFLTGIGGLLVFLGVWLGQHRVKNKPEQSGEVEDGL
jgi:drug/metabolite transporter (DMT)-like permease